MVYLSSKFSQLSNSNKDHRELHQLLYAICIRCQRRGYQKKGGGPEDWHVKQNEAVSRSLSAWGSAAGGIFGAIASIKSSDMKALQTQIE